MDAGAYRQWKTLEKTSGTKTTSRDSFFLFVLFGSLVERESISHGAISVDQSKSISHRIPI